MMEKQSINENFLEITENIKRAANGRDVILLAATKTVSVEDINYSISIGVNHIGENRVQEFLSKFDQYDSSAHKHFIGHLQTNKVKDIVGKVELIHSVSSLKLANEISKISVKKNIVSNILLEVNIGNEDSKCGFLANEVVECAEKISKLPGICIQGLMAIPPICNEPEENRKYFSQMNKLFVDIKAKKLDNSNMVYLSMGMTDDYIIAIEEGANIVRIGTGLYGRRNYNK